MGRKSVKENKSIYQIKREEMDLTREEAAELVGGLSDDRIEKIESGKTPVHPDEVLLMAKAYKCPELSMHYCSYECPIGQKYIQPVHSLELEKTVLEILDMINRLSQRRERLISITADGIITDDERPDLDMICDELERLSVSTMSLKLYVEKKMLEQK